MTVEYLDLADFVHIAAGVTGLDVDTVMKVANLDLADSALHAPAAGFDDTDFYPDFVDKASVLVLRLAKNHPLPDGNKRTAWVALRMFVEIRLDLEPQAKHRRRRSSRRGHRCRRVGRASDRRLAAPSPHRDPRRLIRPLRRLGADLCAPDRWSTAPTPGTLLRMTDPIRKAIRGRRQDAYALVRNQDESLLRRADVKAPLLVLALLATCSGPTQSAPPPTTAPVSTSVSQPATPLSARVVMSSTTIRSGETVDAQVIVENNTGSALHVTGCHSLFAVALGNGTIEPSIGWPLCAQPLTVPVGESMYPVTVSATYLACGEGDTLPPCGTQGDLPGLPPGRYQARLYQQPVVVPAPPPISIEVTR